MTTDTRPGDREIRLKLEARTTEELVAFQEKLKTMVPTPQIRAVGYHVRQVLLIRRLADQEKAVTLESTREAGK